MNKKVIRALSAVISAAMLLSAVPTVMADEQTSAFSSYITDTADFAGTQEESDANLSLMAEQIGGHLVDLNFENEELDSNAGITPSDPAVGFKVVNGEDVDYSGKVLQIGKIADSDLGAKINIATFKWGTDIGERVVVTSFHAASAFLASSETASFALAGGGSAKNITGGFKFGGGTLSLNKGDGSADPKETKTDIKYGALDWYKVNMVSYVNENDEVTKTDYYIDGEKNAMNCIPKDVEITAKQPTLFRVNLDKENSNTAFYIDNLTVIDFKQEMNYIENMFDANSGIPKELLSADNEITLPKTYMGAEVTWTSSDSSIIDVSAADENGTITVNHPTAAKDVKLTASFTYKGAKNYEVDGVQIESEKPHEFNVTVEQGGPMSDETKLKYVADKLELDKTQVTENFTLPLEVRNEDKDITGTVTWTSDNAAIKVDGATAVVTRPSYNMSAATVKLTATITVGTASTTREFILTVPKREEPETDEEKIIYAENQLLALNFSETGTKVTSTSLNLPTEITAGDSVIATLTWKSSDTAWMSNSGELYQQPSSGTHKITLTATVTAGALTEIYNFEVALRAPAATKAFYINEVIWKIQL